MYKCEVCNTNCDHAMLKNVTQTREAEYPEREYKNPRGKKIFDPGGVGREIVNEVAVCSSCFVPPVEKVAPEPQEEATPEP